MKMLERKLACVLALACGLVCWAGPARALPSFARQTGLECTACHMSWLELTTVGRQFKLGGYTLMKPAAAEERPWVSFAKDGPPPVIPLAGFVQASVSHTAKTGVSEAAGTDGSSFPKNDALVLQQASLFLAGRIAEHAGAFAQWTYDGVEHQGAIDNVDIRVADRWRADGVDVTYGLSLNNSPTMSDIFNTTPVWGWPFTTSGVAPAPAAAPLVAEGLAQQVAGLSGYALWNRTVYAELGGYRTASGAFRLFRAGTSRADDAVLKGTAPYWRLALQHEWDAGTHSVMVGSYGLNVHKYPDPLSPSGPTDRFDDLGIDAQYQYITDAERYSAQINVVRETQRLDGTFAAGGAAQARNTLNTITAKVTGYFQNQYGASLGLQRIRGSADAGLYDTGEAVAGSVAGRPDSTAVILEANWLPWRDRRFTLQYTAYQKFNGAKTNYDGFGRNARDNDTLYLVAWFPF